MSSSARSWQPPERISTLQQGADNTIRSHDWYVLLQQSGLKTEYAYAPHKRPRPPSRPSTHQGGPRPGRRVQDPSSDAAPARPPTAVTTTRYNTERQIATAPVQQPPPERHFLTPVPLVGTTDSLPSERAGARKLQAALLAAFERSPAGPIGYKADGAMNVAQLAEEWRLLDMCTTQLVKQMSTRCVEWSEVLEMLRSRQEKLWIGTGASMLQYEREREQSQQQQASPSQKQEVADAAEDASATGGGGMPLAAKAHVLRP